MSNQHINKRKGKLFEAVSLFYMYQSVVCAINDVHRRSRHHPYDRHGHHRRRP